VRRIAILFGTVAAAGAFAQVPLPPSIDPGRIEERAVPERAPPPRLDLPEIKTPAAGAVPEALKAVRVTLTEVRVEGSAALPMEQPQALTNRYLGREITGVDIFELARALTALYRNAGFILSQVVVPPQDLSGGKLTLRVVEGYIASVRIEGDPRAAPTLTELGEKIKASRPLQAGVLERYLLIANDLPGVHVRAVLAPSQTTGAADLTLIATVKRAEAYLSLDNYGSKYLGPAQLTVGATANQLFGINDQLSFWGVSTGNSEMSYGQLSYSQVVNSEGLRLGAAASRTRTRPGDILEPFEVRGRADTVMLSAVYPLWRTRNESLLGRALLDHRNVESDILGTRVIEDKIRALRLGARWMVVDPLDGSNVLDVEFSQGLGGTKQEDVLKSRAGADGTFHKIAFDYERFQRIGESFGLTLGAGGQWTDEPLLSSEQFALGGRRFGRAYEPAELVGDRALALRAEPAYLGRGAGNWLGSYQLYGFYDIGKVWYRDDPATGPNRPGQSLASAGLGARLFATDNVVATLEAAKPLTKPVASYQPGGHGNSIRILGSLTVRF
jgi:hemolysin activation/secretion protein